MHSLYSLPWYLKGESHSLLQKVSGLSFGKDTSSLHFLSTGSFEPFKVTHLHKPASLSSVLVENHSEGDLQSYGEVFLSSHLIIGMQKSWLGHFVPEISKASERSSPDICPQFCYWAHLNPGLQSISLSQSPYPISNCEIY